MKRQRDTVPPFLVAPLDCGGLCVSFKGLSKVSAQLYLPLEGAGAVSHSSDGSKQVLIIPSQSP